jgi:hypothetical protein
MSSSINTFLQFYSIWKLREVEKKKNRRVDRLGHNSNVLPKQAKWNLIAFMQRYSRQMKILMNNDKILA